jgi:hypothetical protein
LFRQFKKEAVMLSSFRAACAALVLLGALPASILADDTQPVGGKEAFNRMKSLAGEWSVTPEDSAHAGHATAGKIVYRVTSNGNTVMETMFADSDHEMVTMYFLDGGELRLTHYCAAGNQPHLKLDKKASKADVFSFAFEGGTNLNPDKDTHMHSGRIMFIDKDHIKAEWDGYSEGKKVGTHKLDLKRP